MGKTSKPPKTTKNICFKNISSWVAYDQTEEAQQMHWKMGIPREYTRGG